MYPVAKDLRYAYKGKESDLSPPTGGFSLIFKI